MKFTILNLMIALGTISIVPSLNTAFAATAQPGNYELDQAHTNIGFEVNHLGFSFVVGRFNDFKGEIKFNPNGESSVDVEIDAASIDTNSEKRDSHLRGTDFFDVSVFPKLVYKSTAIEFDQDGSPSIVRGTLSLHGVTLPVDLIVRKIGAGEDPFGDVRMGYQAKASIKRTDFGMNSFLSVASDEIEITINLEAIKQ